jgi:hypothetical protein
MSMTITYDLSVDDFVAFTEHYYQNSPLFKRFNIAIRVIAPLCLVILGLINYLRGMSVFPALISAVIIVAIFPLICTMPMGWFTRKICREGAQKGLIGRHELEITATGITERTCVGTQTTTWEGIERIETTPTHGYIYIGSALAHVIPVNSVTDGNFQEFMAEVRKRKGDKP